MTTPNTQENTGKVLGDSRLAHNCQVPNVETVAKAIISPLATCRLQRTVPWYLPVLEILLPYHFKPLLCSHARYADVRDACPVEHSLENWSLIYGML